MTRIAQWISNGPPDGAGTPTWFLGSLLWWRSWAIGLCFAMPLMIAMTALQYVSAGEAILTAWFVSVIGGQFALFLSPKYDVTRNY